MKKNRLPLPVLTFFLGMAIGVATFSLYSFKQTESRAIPQAGITPIAATDANVLVKNYMSTATIPNRPIKGFYLDTLQLNAIKLIARENPKLSGYRIYLGKDRNNLPVGIVVGVDGRRMDATTNTIYITNSVSSGPCPFVCDVNSTVGKD